MERQLSVSRLIFKNKQTQWPRAAPGTQLVQRHGVHDALMVFLPGTARAGAVSLTALTSRNILSLDFHGLFPNIYICSALLLGDAAGWLTASPGLQSSDSTALRNSGKGLVSPASR